MLALKDKNHTKTAQTSSVESVADEIIKYKQLLDEGIITEEEFSAKKGARLLLMQPRALHSSSIETSAHIRRSGVGASRTMQPRASSAGSARIV